MTSSRFDLVTVGNAVVDYIHRVSVLPRVDDGVAILDRQVGPGGVEGNVAAAAARLGLRVGIVARVGRDEPGAMLLDDFRQRGVDTSRLHLGGADDTAYTLVFVDGSGDRMMMTGGHGVRKMTLDDTDDRYMQSARAVFTSGYLPWPHLERVAALCAAPGGPLLAFDLPGTFDDLRARGLHPEHVDAILPTVDLFLTDRDSLRDYSGIELLEDGVAFLHTRGVQRASVSDGAHGLFVTEDSTAAPAIQHIPAFSVNAVDTTGAGDVLHAALIAAWLLDGQPAVQAGRFAAAAASLSCRGWGTRSSLPTREETETLARSRD